MDFIPDKDGDVDEAPYFDDVSSDGGWRGHTTTKSIDTLKSEIAEAITRLGGFIVSFQFGTFVVGEQKREGYQINYIIADAMKRGRLDLAALPVKDNPRSRRTLKKRQTQSLKMALYMTRDALDGLWFLQKLSPGYASLMPWMIDDKSGKTISRLWREQAIGQVLLPESVDAEFQEV